jgi:hypothetical protein
LKSLLSRLFLIFLFLSPKAHTAPTETWQERSNEDVKVLFHPGEGENVSGVLETFSRLIPDLEEKLGVSLPYIPQIYVVTSQEEFDAVTRGALPPWSQGVSFPRGGQIVLKSPSFAKDIDTFNKTALHELVHLMIGVKTLNNIPRWLNEGLAQMLSGEAQGKPLMPLSRALWSGKIIPLDLIEGVDRFTHKEAELAYLQSFHAAEFLIKIYGWESLRELLTYLGQGNAWNDALFTAIELDHVGFEAAWIEEVKKSHRWMILMDAPFYILIGATVLVLLAGIAVIRRRRQIYRKWEAEDGPYTGTF